MFDCGGITGKREQREGEERERERVWSKREECWRREGSHLVAVEEKVEALKDDAELLLESGHGSCPFHLDVPDAVMML